jgi:inner membrane protease subunit 1
VLDAKNSRRPPRRRAFDMACMLRRALRGSPAVARQLRSLRPGAARPASSRAEAAATSAVAPADGSAASAAWPATAGGSRERGDSDAGGEASWSWDEEVKQIGDLLLFGAAMHVLTSCFLCTTQCVGPSMTPTISTDGDVLLAVPFCLYRRVHGGLPPLDSVVLCTSPSNPDQTVCKRVLGLPGDTVTVLPPPGRASAIRRFGSAPGELQARSVEPPPGTRAYQLSLPRGHVWLQGDNLGDSTDSRIYGPVPVALIQSVAVLRLWPFRTAGSLPSAPGREVEAVTRREGVAAIVSVGAGEVGVFVGAEGPYVGEGIASGGAGQPAGTFPEATIPAATLTAAHMTAAATVPAATNTTVSIREAAIQAAAIPIATVPAATLAMTASIPREAPARTGKAPASAGDISTLASGAHPAAPPPPVSHEDAPANPDSTSPRAGATTAHFIASARPNPYDASPHTSAAAAQFPASAHPSARLSPHDASPLATSADAAPTAHIGPAIAPTVQTAGGSTVHGAGGSIVHGAGGSTVHGAGGSTVQNAGDSARPLARAAAAHPIAGSSVAGSVSLMAVSSAAGRVSSSLPGPSEDCLLPAVAAESIDDGNTAGEGRVPFTDGRDSLAAGRSSIESRIASAAAMLSVVKARLHRLQDEGGREEVRRAVEQAEEALHKLARLQRERGQAGGG